MKQQTRVICLLVLSLLVTGCSVDQIAIPTSATKQAVAPVSTPAPDPTSTDVPAPPIKTLCLKVDDSQFQNAAREPLNEDLGDILTLAGMRVMRDTSAACDATLLISLVGTPRSGEYQSITDPNDWTTCYTGASVGGEMTLRQPDRDSLVWPISGNDPVSEGMISACPSAAEAPFYRITMSSLLFGLESFWGTEMLVYAQAVDPGWSTGLSRLAIESLGKRNPELVVPVIIKLLNTHSDASVRVAALNTLPELSRLPSEGALAIRQSLEDENALVRETAMEVLALVEPDAQAVVADENLERLNDSKDENLRIEAAGALGQAGADATVIQALISVFEDPEESDSVREAVALALADIGPETVPWLAEGLAQEDIGVIQGCALALKKLGSAGDAAIPALILCLGKYKPDATRECSMLWWLLAQRRRSLLSTIR